jgi:hypothetical protein
MPDQRSAPLRDPGAAGPSFMTASDPAPRTSARTRLLRPETFPDDVTGTLASATLLAYLGLATRADDAGFLVWRPAALTAAIMPYAHPARRQRDLERIAEELVAVGLLRMLDCGCAELPRMVRDLAIKGGSHSTSIRDWHLAHVPPDASEPVQTPTSESVSFSGSFSSSESDTGPLSGPGSGDGPGADSGRARGWTNQRWLDELHRLGMPMDRVDRTWSPWLASLTRRHADQAILDAITLVVGSGETRPQLVQELVGVALEQLVGSAA